MALDLAISISKDVETKLQEKHGVSRKEVCECFMNVEGKFLEDTREDHKSNPPTEWFIAPTNKGRELKVCFVQVGNNIDIKTAYEPSDIERRIFEKHAF